MPRAFRREGFRPLERIWARPTAEINGIGGGYQGEGTKTVLPSKAFAKLTFRLVPDQEPQKMIEKVQAYFQKTHRPCCAAGNHAGPQWRTVSRRSQCRLRQGRAKGAQKTLPGQETALIREGGSIPIVADFKSILNADTLLLGLCLPDCNAHSPNETFPLSHLDLGANLNRHLLEEIAAA